MIPTSTLEDFPTDLNDDEACSLLAAWSVLWHPNLIAGCDQIPTWYRADAPPEPHLGSGSAPATGSESDALDSEESRPTLDFDGRLFVVPSPSIEQLPSGYQDRTTAAGAVWITGGNRSEMIANLVQAGLVQPDLPAQTDGNRTIGVEDFFAAGFALLQIEIMTRRLRYTSNLDQIHLQRRTVDAAIAYLENRTGDAIEALHDVFDALAEERDHYFTSDPHLLDLTLIAASTIDAAVNLDWNATNQVADEADGVLSTPASVLIDADALPHLASRQDETSQSLVGLLREHKLAWAAGGPKSSFQFDSVDYASAAAAITAANQETKAAIGSAAKVYGRLSGGTPSDLIPAIANQGYIGIIPIDFVAGTGHDAEAKVLLPTPGGEIEALTAKPIDASSDASFLTIGAKLGESIDSGEVATALLVHWPGQGCDSFHDLKRVATWSISLGRFWRIDDYFTSGERPYHQGNLSTNCLSSESALQEGDNPVSRAGRDLIQSAVRRRDRLNSAMAQLLDGKTDAGNPRRTDQIARAVRSIPDDAGDARLIVNPYSSPQRFTAPMAGPVAAMKHVFASTKDGDGQLVSVDVPAFGFAIARPVGSGERAASGQSAGAGVGGWLRGKFLGRTGKIADDGRLHNEFMEVEISDKFGGISGVYSGGVRGNRFSMRLVAEGLEATMICDHRKVLRNSEGSGSIQTKGRLMSEDSVLAEFVMTFSLIQGSRVIEVAMELTPKLDLGEDRWKNYIAARVAVSENSSVCRPLVRDKIHRTSRRRMVAPLGILIDEADRQTLVTSDGYPYHRAVGERFFDTILCVRGESETKFRLRYGFDVPSPVATAWSQLAPPTVTSVQPDPAIATSGWMAHVTPSEVLIGDMIVHPVASKSKPEATAMEIQLIATRGKSCNAKLRFFCDVKSAHRVFGPIEQMLQQIAEASEDSGAMEQLKSNSLKVDGDAVVIPITGHEVANVLVLFKRPHLEGQG